jgi:hypothetical protein
MPENERTEEEKTEALPVEEQVKPPGEPEAEAAEEEEKLPPCPTCGEEWEGDAVFCSYCGYEKADEDNPLHPLPVLNEGICDAAGVLSDEEISGIKAVIAEFGKSRPVIFATFITPEDQTPAGIAFTLYNNWTVGKHNADVGLLVYYDPGRRRIEIVLGKNIEVHIDGKTIQLTVEEFAGDVGDGHIVEGFRKVAGRIFES